MLKSVLLLTSIFILSPSYSQVVDEIDSSSSSLAESVGNLPTEKIQKISPSKRIFIISNSNNSFDKGDFISIIQGSKLVARALVAKMSNEIAGIKILRIHSLSLWNGLRNGSEIQILRGDDSYFNKPEKKVEAEEKDLAKDEKVVDEDDLYGDTKIIDDDLSVEEKKNRSIKNDNIVTGAYGRVEGIDENEASTYYGQFMLQWAYQIDDNIWVEGGYGQNIVRDFPSTGLDTTLRNITFRAKYTVPAPFYSYVQPYIGYQMISASSDQAGQEDGSATPEELQREDELMDKIAQNRPVFGVSILKRLVPGWFVKVDLGTDIMNLGFSLEF